MDEQHIGPNINAIPEQCLSELASTLVEKQWCSNWKVSGSTPA